MLVLLVKMFGFGSCLEEEEEEEEGVEDGQEEDWTMRMHVEEV